MSEPNINTIHPGPNLNPHKPKHAIPEGVIDCHCHVFDQFDKYPLTPNRSYTPARATLEQYLAMCKTVGIARTVQVNASTFGMDNSLTFDLISTLGQDKARGICGVTPDTPSSEIERLHNGGFR